MPQIPLGCALGKLPPRSTPVAQQTPFSRTEWLTLEGWMPSVFLLPEDGCPSWHCSWGVSYAQSSLFVLNELQDLKMMLLFVGSLPPLKLLAATSEYNLTIVCSAIPLKICSVESMQ